MVDASIVIPFPLSTHSCGRAGVMGYYPNYEVASTPHFHHRPHIFPPLTPHFPASTPHFPPSTPHFPRTPHFLQTPHFLRTPHPVSRIPYPVSRILYPVSHTSFSTIPLHYKSDLHFHFI